MSAWRVCLCAAILAFSAAYAEATMIDSFNDGSQALFVDLYGQSASNQVATSAAIGGYRDTALQWSSGDLDFANVLPPGDIFSFTEGTAEGETTLTWDGANSPGVLSYALNANLTSSNNNEFLIDVISVTGTGVGLTMTVYTDATHASQYVTTVPAGGSSNLLLPYSLFSQIGANGANFSNVGAIVLEFNGVGHAGSDITIGPIQTVPEPSTLALAAIGAMVALGFGRRWRRA